MGWGGSGYGEGESEACDDLRESPIAGPESRIGTGPCGAQQAGVEVAEGLVVEGGFKSVVILRSAES